MNKIRKQKPAPVLGASAEPSAQEEYEFAHDELAELEDLGDALFLLKPASVLAETKADRTGNSYIRELGKKP